MGRLLGRRACRPRPTPRPSPLPSAGIKAEAYDPRSCDVWAAGVFLCVALLGAFPFDHTKEVHLRGLEAARKGLRPGGLLAVWSAAPNKDFVYRLGRAGFAVEEVKARANKGKGVRHIIWVATNPVRSR